MSASVPGAAPAAASTTVLGEVETWFLKVMHAAQNLWTQAKAAETDATAYVATHPEVVAVADTLEAMAPPAVQTAINAGLSVAEEVATSINNIESHAAATGLPMASVKA